MVKIDAAADDITNARERGLAREKAGESERERASETERTKESERDLSKSSQQPMISPTCAKENRQERAGEMRASE